MGQTYKLKRRQGRDERNVGRMYVDGVSLLEP
jgi:hypothetical protein